MSSSNITPAVRSSLEKYKDENHKLKDTYAAKVTENNSLKEELRKYQVEVRTFRRETDLCNNNIVKSFCKNKL